MSTLLAVRGHYTAHRLDHDELGYTSLSDDVDAVLRSEAPVTHLPIDELAKQARARHADLVVIVVGRQGEESFPRPLGFALLERRPASPWRPVDIRLAGEGKLDRQSFHLVEPEVAATLALGVATFVRRHRVWRLHLDQVSPNDPTLAYLVRCLPRLRAQAGDPIPLLRWPDERRPGRWASKKTRAKHRTACRRLDESGSAWRVHRLRNAGEIRAALPRTLEVRAARERQLARRDAFADAAGQRHVQRVLDLATEGNAEVWLLTLDGTLVTYVVVGCDDGKRVLVDSRMRPGYERRSPGLVLFGHMLATWYVDDAVRVVDFGRGINDFKRGLRNEVEERLCVRAWSNPALEYADRGRHVADARLRACARSVRDRSPLVAGVVRRWRAHPFTHP
ncbi:GNAT family N-acetyltransferase [Dermacoccus sp. PAMC28757]|uniref:GNAT family N-acetyltransferase n=1 Tax=Dermacoccus sp. PAMC28757 TaxID=2762331 RepID=UPI00164D9C27|nr:GNAT family N-acetyltransferase [Dermacoccus sp. PAMC28757]QNK53917.1 GNAT family N-acetyltransferase [Dermacoccus sp. PAMC28757]